MTQCIDCWHGLRHYFAPETIRRKNVHDTYYSKFLQPDTPIRVAVTGVAGQIAYALLPMIANGDMFGKHQKVIIHGVDLDIPAVQDNLRGVRMELEDGFYPLLHDVVFTTDPNVAFKDADVAVLLGAFPRKQGMERKDLMKKNIAIFKTMGEAIDRNASRDCKVLVVGNPANTNCLVCSKFAPSLPKKNFSALTRLDHNRALAQVALKADALVSDVKNVIIWGNHSSTQYPDVSHGTVNGKPITEVLSDHTSFLKGDFIETIQKRGAAILNARNASSALSAARGVCNHIFNWCVGTAPGEYVSMAIVTDSTGFGYGIQEGLVYSYPVTCKNGEYEVVKGLSIDAFSREKMKITEEELQEERELALALVTAA